jgi:uncharacterized BrkB/YihY/UPF0761 family membrane protein
VKQTIKRIVFGLWAFICLMIIAICPVNQYEWMQQEEDIVLPIDNNADIYPIITFITLTPLFFFLFYFILFYKIKSNTERRIFSIAIIGLLIFWIKKFFF